MRKRTHKYTLARTHSHILAPNGIFQPQAFFILKKIESWNARYDVFRIYSPLNMLMNSKHPNGISHSYHLINPCANHFKWNAIGIKVMKFFPIIFNIDLFFSAFLFLFRCDDGNGLLLLLSLLFLYCVGLSGSIHPMVILYHILPWLCVSVSVPVRKLRNDSMCRFNVGPSFTFHFDVYK